MATLPPPAAGSKADSPAQQHRHEQRPSTTKEVGDEGEEAKEGFEGDDWEEGEVERGMLNGLVELGHLEMLLHQVLFATRNKLILVKTRHSYKKAT